jgi:predicted outer membrane repeat protein
MEESTMSACSIARGPGAGLIAVAGSSLLSMMCGHHARADILNVPGDYPTIQDALWAAHHGDEIVVADGTYSGPGFYDLEYAGLLITIRSASGDPTLCTLDCQMMGRAFTFDNGESEESILEGFTIANGFEIEGAGVWIGDATPTVRDCTFLDCFGDINGGGAYITGGFLSFENCTFQGCSTFNDGGAICACEGGASSITDCTFQGNWATLGPGGAIYSVGGAGFTISQSTFADNSAGSVGGAVFSDGAGLTLEDCCFIGNDAGGHGGAVYVEDGELLVDGNSFEYGETAGSGGAIAAEMALLNITDSLFSNNRAGGVGGALLSSVGDATLTDCTFEFNEAESADDGGGAIYQTEGDVTLAGCSFESNTAQRFGGALYADDGDADLTDCTFTDSLTTDGSHAFAGGAAIASVRFGTFTMTGSTLAGNSSAASGGGLFIAQGGAAIVNACSLQDNEALGPGAHGGAIRSEENESLFVTGTTFEGNSCDDWGGAIGVYGPSLVTDCSFVDNTAFASGGALMNSSYGDLMTILNCRFNGNQAWNAGAIDTRTSTLIANCTFSGNVATSFGYGGAITVGGDAAASIVNCTMWANTADIAGGAAGCWGPSDFHNCILRENTPDEIHDPNGLASLYFCDIEGGWTGNGSNNIDADPLFIDPDGLDDLPGTEDDNLRLLPLSPCIDAADNTAVPPDEFDLDGDGDTNEPIPIDLDGDDRFVDDPATEDTGNGTPPIVDMGAYEFQACPADFDHDDDVDTADLLHLLAAWGTAGGDTDYDGDTDTADLLTLLGTWGECP